MLRAPCPLPEVLHEAFFFLLLLCLCGIGQASAETRYITDMTEVMLRKGEGIRYKVVRGLMSGEAVEELSTNRRTGYSRVRTKDGTTGYILTHQLQDEPGAREQLAAMKARLADFQQAPDQLAVRFTELQSEMEALKQEKEQREEELAAIKYASTNLVSIIEERSELRKRVADLTRQVDDLRQKNQDRESETHQRWFLIGAGVTTGAILIGPVVPHVSFRRKKPWGTI